MFTARGQIRGRGCSIGGSVLWEGCDLVGADGVALWFDGADIDGNLAIVHAPSGPHRIFCRPYVEGAVRVNGANIRGAVIVQHADLEGTTAEALMVSGCSVGMSLVILDARLGGDVWLTDTKGRALVDDLDPAGGSWRTARRLVLTGFQYDRFEHEWDPRLRFAWLRQTDGHQPQAWSQLADVYRRNGRAEDARRAEIARENDRLERAGLGAPERAGRRILRVVIGHGYRPWLAAVWSLAIVLAFALLVWASLDSYVPRQGAVGRHPEPVAYSLDTFLPIVDLGQAAKWAPTGAVRWVDWTVILLGWALSTIFVARLTRVVRTEG